MKLSLFSCIFVLFLFFNSTFIYTSYIGYPSIPSLFILIPLTLPKLIRVSAIAFKRDSKIFNLDDDAIPEDTSPFKLLDNVSWVQTAPTKIQDLVSLINDLEKDTKFLNCHHSWLDSFLNIGKDSISFIRHHKLIFILVRLKKATAHFIQASLDVGLHQSMHSHLEDLPNLIYLLGQKLLELNSLTFKAQEKMIQLQTCHYPKLNFTSLLQYPLLFSELNTLIEHVSQLHGLQMSAKEAFLSKTALFSADWNTKDTQVALLLSQAFQNFTRLQSQIAFIKENEVLETKLFLTYLLDQVQKEWEQTYLKTYKGLDYMICLGLMKLYTKLSTEEVIKTFSKSDLAQNQYPCDRTFSFKLFNRELLNHFYELQLRILADEESKGLDHRGYW